MATLSGFMHHFNIGYTGVFNRNTTDQGIWIRVDTNRFFSRRMNTWKRLTPMTEASKISNYRLDRRIRRRSLVPRVLVFVSINPERRSIWRCFWRFVKIKDFSPFFQSDKGDRWIERILSLKQTCRIKTISSFHILEQALNNFINEQEPDLNWIA